VSICRLIPSDDCHLLHPTGNSVGVLLVYDVCNHASFEHIPLWLLEAKRHIEPYRPVFALVGCKLDLVNNGENREVSVEEAKTFAEQHELIYVETSARTGINVRESFALVTQEIHSRIKSGEYKVESGWEGIKTGELMEIRSIQSTHRLSPRLPPTKQFRLQPSDGRAGKELLLLKISPQSHFSSRASAIYRSRQRKISVKVQDECGRDSNSKSR
jgi:hypothetical protein